MRLQLSEESSGVCVRECVCERERERGKCYLCIPVNLISL